MLKTAYFNDSGILTDVYPRQSSELYEDRETAYRADYFVVGKQCFDLSNAADISAIQVPNFYSTANILELSYIIKIRCGIVTDQNLIRPFTAKTLELMQASHFFWRSRDYLQVIRNYYRCGLFKEGDSFEEEFRRSHPHLFNDPAIAKHELEHQRTKQYFFRKWMKNNKDNTK